MVLKMQGMNERKSVCTLIDDKNEPISAREIRQLLKNVHFYGLLMARLDFYL